MSKTVEELMVQGVVVATPDHTVGYVQRQILTLDIQAVPVADGDGKPLGMVRSRDLLGAKDPDSPVADVMCKELVTIDRRATADTAASMMRQYRSRQLVVTDGGKIVGIVSAFDLLSLIAGEMSEFATGVIDLKAFRNEIDGA